MGSIAISADVRSDGPLARGTSFKNIADVLGHQLLQSTATYAKLDLPALSRIAMPWPGDKLDPSLDNLGEAYVKNQIDVEGKLADIIDVDYALARRHRRSLESAGRTTGQTSPRQPLNDLLTGARRVIDVTLSSQQQRHRSSGAQKGISKLGQHCASKY
jgi:hypothetical protein